MGYTYRMLPDRFVAKFHVDPESGCWLWTASLNKYGYGQFRVRPRTRGAHRVAYEALIGPIPEGMQLDHLCRVRRCVNPAHLEPVTMAVNIARGDVEARYEWNRAKTHCPQGHPYSATNTYHDPARPHRICRACSREASRRYDQRHRA